MSQAAYQPEERARVERQLTEDAIQLALASKWDEAVAANRQLLAIIPHDLSAVHAFNRLGKALSELGDYAEAKKAYSESLALDPTNSIARKNFDRVTQLADGTPSRRAATAAERIDPRLFIEETGKTGFTNLVDTARNVLATLSAGEQVYLEPEGNLLYVRNAAGERLGRIEARLASRLIKFMQAGNQYAAGIAELHGNTVRLIIRETFQHPSQFGRVSFTARSSGDTIRPYIKDTMVRYEQDDDDEFGEDGEYLDDGDEEAEETREPDLEESDYAEPEV